MSNEIEPSINPATQKDTQILVFTDFDGTLLDHDTYSFEPAVKCMQRLTASKIPIIANTSKTFSEVTVLLKEMQLNTPFIIENGSAVCMPKDFLPEKPKGSVWKNGVWVKSFAQSRTYWQELSKRLMNKYPDQYECFAQMSIERICELTGLAYKAAELAATRQYSEPLFWKGTEEQKTTFIDEIKSLGASPLIGGRFLHVCGDANKGKAMRWLCDEFERQNKPLKSKSIALGDGHNDVAMLEAADISVRIASPAHKPPKLTRNTHSYISKAYGPQGWSEVLDQLIPE